MPESNQLIKRILVIEDEPSLSTTLSDNFTHEGFNVMVADDGEKGLATALALKPDLILLDLLMPKMDGMTMFRKLRKEGGEYGKTVKVIILTNLTNRDDQRMNDVTELEPVYYFEKVDWKIEDLIAKIKEVLV